MEADIKNDIYDIEEHIAPRLQCFMLDCLPTCRADNVCPSCLARELLEKAGLIDEFLVHVIDFYEVSDLILIQPIEYLELSTRASNCIKWADIFTIEELLMFSSKRLLDVPQLGIKTLFEIQLRLFEHGLTLAPD